MLGKYLVLIKAEVLSLVYLLISGTFCGLDIDFIQQGGFKKGYWIRGFMFSEDLSLNHAIIHSKIRERES